MQWIRLNRRIGAWAALFALTLQLVLSFSHVHVPKSLLTSALATTVSQQLASRDGAPSSPQQHNGADDFCAICATIGLLASSALPESTSFVVPVAVPAAWPHEHAGIFVPFDSHLLFQARGPPAAV
jgi:hypothetical protein